MKWDWLIIPVGIAFMVRTNLKTAYDEAIVRVSTAHGNDPALVKAIIWKESRFNSQAHAVNSKENSRGLGQINENTARALGVTDTQRLFDPEYNIEIMNRVLDDLKKRHDTLPDIIAAYNAGSVKVDRDGYFINDSYFRDVYSRYLLYKALWT